MSYSQSTWRDDAAPIISRVLEETKGLTERDIRQALTRAYPFGVRSGWPYQVWLDEIRKQRYTGRRFRVLAPGEKLVFPDAPL